MRDAFIRWLNGTPPAIVGAWWSGSGVCFVRMVKDGGQETISAVVYEPCGKSVVIDSDAAAVERGELINVLRNAAERLGASRYRYAVGIPSGDIFTKSIKIPSGLDDLQVEQLSLVEAISNLPVPPEEVCADFLRNETTLEAMNETVEVAFCKRALIDELSLLAEDAALQVAVVDRDIQAIHDAAVWCASGQLTQAEALYPLGIVMPGDRGRFIICRGPLDLNGYELPQENASSDHHQENVEVDSLAVYCRRAGLSESTTGYLKTLWVVNETPGKNSLSGVAPYAALAQNVGLINPLVADLAPGAPVEGLMVALGMALRI